MLLIYLAFERYGWQYLATWLPGSLATGSLTPNCCVSMSFVHAAPRPRRKIFGSWLPCYLATLLPNS